MKIRRDFVSNSSSCSFIIDRVEGTTDNIPFSDMKTAILKCFKTKLLDTEIRIYDLSTPELFDKAMTAEKSFLKGWQDTMNGHSKTFEEVSNILKDYGKIDFDPDIPAWQQNGKQLETPVIQTLNILRKNMGVKKMLEVMEAGYAQVLICMEENLVWQSDGFDEPIRRGYQTTPCTAERFCELVSRNLWGLGYDNADYRDLKFAFHGNAHQG